MCLKGQYMHAPLSLSLSCVLLGFTYQTSNAGLELSSMLFDPEASLLFFLNPFMCASGSRAPCGTSVWKYMLPVRSSFPYCSHVFLRLIVLPFPTRGLSLIKNIIACSLPLSFDLIRLTHSYTHVLRRRQSTSINKHCNRNQFTDLPRGHAPECCHHNTNQNFISQSIQ